MSSIKITTSSSIKISIGICKTQFIGIYLTGSLCLLEEQSIISMRSRSIRIWARRFLLDSFHIFISELYVVFQIRL